MAKALTTNNEVSAVADFYRCLVVLFGTPVVSGSNLFVANYFYGTIGEYTASATLENA